MVFLKIIHKSYGSRKLINFVFLGHVGSQNFLGGGENLTLELYVIHV